MALIEQALLRGAGFGSQSCPEKSALSMEKTAQAGKECGVGCRQRPGQILEIHIYTGVSPLKDCLQDLLNQLFLNCRIRQDKLSSVGVKLS